MGNTGLMRRFAAMLYDTLLVLALMILATVPFVITSGGENVEPESLAHQLILFIVIYGFFVGFWTTKGRTLGMQSWGLQLEDKNGATPSIGQCSIRFFAALLSLACVGIGFLWQLIDKDKLTWHDRLSGTRLVHYPKPKG